MAKKTTHGIISQIIDDWKRYKGLDEELDFNVQALASIKDEYDYHELAAVIKVYVGCDYVGEITMWNETDCVLVESRFYGAMTNTDFCAEYLVYKEMDKVYKYIPYSIPYTPTKEYNTDVPELLGYDEFLAAMQEN